MAGGISNIPTLRRGRTVDIASPESYEVRRYHRMCLSLVGLLLLVLGPFALWAMEKNIIFSSDAIMEIRRNGKTVDLSNPMSALQSKNKTAAYFQTSAILANVVDPHLNLQIPRALKAERQTEYCQWEEFSRDVCETCYRPAQGGNNNTMEAYSCNCKREYWYLKSWKSYRINSLVFNQPAAHWNPQDDPYPSVSLFAQNVRFANVPVSSALIAVLKGASRPIRWTFAGTREPHWLDFLGFASSDKARYEDIKQLSGVASSVAATQDNFLYAGQGWFFKPKLVSVQERLLKALFQYVEGSLLDYQLGDLVPSCEAGDIKFKYLVTDPEVVSGIGEITEAGELDTYTTSHKHAFGVLYSGAHSQSALLDSEMWSLKLWSWGARVLLGLSLAYTVHVNLLAFLGLVMGALVATSAQLVSVAVLAVFTTRAFILRNEGLTSSADMTVALVSTTVAFLAYSTLMLTLPRKSSAKAYGFAGLWELWSQPTGVFVDGIHSAAASASAAEHEAAPATPVKYN